MLQAIKFSICWLLLFPGVLLAQSETDTCFGNGMRRAWYESSAIQKRETKINGPEIFQVHVDTSRKASNFISGSEDYYKVRIMETEFMLSYEVSNWDSLSGTQKNEWVINEKRRALHQLDSIHTYNNETNKLEVLVWNNSPDTVSLTIQDGSFQCILEAKNGVGEWQPIDLWIFSNCGNSYYRRHFAPQESSSFVFDLPHTGSFETQLRFKLRLEEKKYCYSNVFNGKIDLCNFISSGKLAYYQSLRNRQF